MGDLYMNNSEESNVKYVLVLEENLSSYNWLFPVSSADSKAGIDELSRLIATFGTLVFL